MGTRGAVGVVIGKQEKVGYNHWDSYPSGVGVEVLRYLRSADLDEVRSLAEALRVVNEDDKPTASDINRLRQWTNLNVSEQSSDDWYCLTRETQGDLNAMLQCGYVIDARTFPLDSLFCEWAYIIDLDHQCFEVYRGFQDSPHSEGRFASRIDIPRHNYWPVRLVASWPLDSLPTDDEFIEMTEGAEEDEEEDEDE